MFEAAAKHVVEVTHNRQPTQVHPFDDWDDAAGWLTDALQERWVGNDNLARAHHCDHYPCLYLRGLVETLSALEESAVALRELRRGDSFEREIEGVKYRLRSPEAGR